MSTIKSSNEHLTLNADGSGKDIKFQSNGSEKASISSAGAFTSTTIDATKLTGTIPNFTSTGIDDNADATAMTITSDEKVGIGTSSPARLLTVYGDTGIALQNSTTGTGTGNGTHIWVNSTGSGELLIQNRENSDIEFLTNDAERMRITSDGRGLSQFTAKAWVNFDGTGTAAIRDSHNVSSLTDNGTGDFTINFSNNMGNTNYSTSIGNYRSTGDTGIGGSNIVSIAVGSIRFETVRDASTKMNPNFCNLLVFGD